MSKSITRGAMVLIGALAGCGRQRSDVASATTRCRSLRGDTTYEVRGDSLSPLPGRSRIDTHLSVCDSSHYQLRVVVHQPVPTIRP